MGTKVVSGYVPIPQHPRTAAEYGALGEALFKPLAEAGVEAKVYFDTVRDCWLHKHLPPCSPAMADNPAKNTIAYHVTQHQKFGWLLKAAIECPHVDTFVWLDFGLIHVPGITPKLVLDFLGRIKKDDFAIPGCWTKEQMMLNDMFPCWRFCGGVLIVPRATVARLYKVIKANVLKHTRKTGVLSWEVNSLARTESKLSPRWYYADHNATLLENY
jgi:hypothetical protein